MSITGVSGAGSSLTGIRSLFQNVEQNGGQITKEQLEQAAGGANSASGTQRADALFNKLDTNGDGVVDQSELQAARQAHHHHHHGGGAKVAGDTQSSLLQTQEAAIGAAAAPAAGATGLEIIGAAAKSDTANQTLASLVLNLTDIVSGS